MTVGQSASQKRPTLLIVEDDDVVRDAVVYILSGEKYDIVDTSSAEDALRLIEVAELDALYTDIDLGGSINGWQVAAAFHQRWPQAPMVFASARKHLRPPGAPAAGVFLLKPFAFDHLISALEDESSSSAALPLEDRMP